MTFELLDLLGGFSVLDLDRIKVCLCRNGRGVRFAQRCFIVCVRGCGVRHFLLELGLLLLGVLQPLCVVVLAVVALAELITGGLQRLLILTDGIFLQGELPLQRSQMGGKPRRGLLKVVHPGTCQLERGLRFLDLLLDGFDVAGEVIAV